MNFTPEQSSLFGERLSAAVLKWPPSSRCRRRVVRIVFSVPSLEGKHSKSLEPENCQYWEFFTDTVKLSKLDVLMLGGIGAVRIHNSFTGADARDITAMATVSLDSFPPNRREDFARVSNAGNG